MAQKTSTEAFGNSAFLSHLHSVAWPTETEPMIAQMLAILGEKDPSVAKALASIAMRRDAYVELALWSKRLEDHAWRDRLGKGLGSYLVLAQVRFLAVWRRLYTFKNVSQNFLLCST